VLRPWSGRGRDAPAPAQRHDRCLQFLGQRADLIRSVPDLPVRWVDDVVAAVARRVVRPGEAVAESALNGWLRMFVLDAAFFHRHAVDTGVLRRAPDGARYELTED